MRIIRSTIAVVLPLVIAASVATTVPAFAKGGNGQVRKSGACSPRGTWKLKAAPDNGRLQVELEVDSNVNGQTWSWKLYDNNAQVAAGTSRTAAPSGSFAVRRLVTNRAGTDNLRAVARNAKTGAVCRGALSI